MPGEWVINKENTCCYQCGLGEASSFRMSTCHVGQQNPGWEPRRVGSTREKHRLVGMAGCGRTSCNLDNSVSSGFKDHHLVIPQSKQGLRDSWSLKLKSSPFNRKNMVELKMSVWLRGYVTEFRLKGPRRTRKMSSQDTHDRA